MFRSIFSLCLVICLASNAHAVKNDFTGVYGGLSLGVASSNMHTSKLGNIDSTQKRSSQYGFMLGAGKQMSNNMYYGLEVAGSKFDNMSRHMNDQFVKFRHQASITPIIGWVCQRYGTMPFVKFGYTRMGGHSTDSADNLHGALFGFGVNYMLTKNIIVRGEYELSRMSQTGYSTTFNAVKLGVVYKFDAGTF